MEAPGKTDLGSNTRAARTRVMESKWDSGGVEGRGGLMRLFRIVARQLNLWIEIWRQTAVIHAGAVAAAFADERIHTPSRTSW